MRFIEKIKRQKLQEKKVRKKDTSEKIGHNSGPTQKQTCFCEPIKEPIKNKKENRITIKKKQNYTSKEKYIENSWTQ